MDRGETHVAWTLKRGAPLTPSPLLVGDELYLVHDTGILSCLNPKTGDAYWHRKTSGRTLIATSRPSIVSRAR